MQNCKEKSIRERIHPKIYDPTYILTKSNNSVFKNALSFFSKENPLKVLDLGCGYKPFKIIIEQEFMHTEYVGIDISSENAEPDLILDLNKDILPFQDNTFDLVILSEVLEHLFEPTHALKEAIRVCKKGGYIYISTPFLFGNHDKKHDYFRFTDLFYKRFFKETGLEIIQLKKSGSIITAPLFLVNLFIAGLLRNRFGYVFYPLFALNNLVSLLIDFILQSLAYRSNLIFKGKEYLYFGIALIVRK